MRQHQESVKNLAIGGRPLQGPHPVSDGRHRHHVPLLPIIVITIITVIIVMQ